MKWPLGRKGSDSAKTAEDAGEPVGLFLFDEASASVRAEGILKAAGYDIALTVPPLHLRIGCDLAVSIPSVERPGAERALAERDVRPRGWVDTPEGALDLTDAVTVQELGEWLMVRAGNAKITVEIASRRIVNVSGGGCPDVGFLALELVGRTLEEALRPSDLGYTLCGLMLDRAFAEARSRLSACTAEEVRTA